jgi:hypothetical protein
MSMKRVVSATAVAAGVGISALTLDTGFASSAPLDPPPPCPNGSCHGGPGGPGGPGNGSENPRAPETSATTEPPRTQSTAPPSTHVTTPPATQTTTPPATHTTPPATHTTTAPATQTTPPPATQTTTPAAQTTTPPSAKTTTPAGTQTTTQSGPQVTVTLALIAPSTQPPHPPYVPRGAYARGNAQVGGPTDASGGFSLVDHGAPPPPPPRGFGWNDGPAPGHPPPNWDGPPPPGGWNGPPPPGGWNRPWNGPPRDVERARGDFGPFAYNTFTVFPVFNWQFGGWGYWFFGVWVPLY